MKINWKTAFEVRLKKCVQELKEGSNNVELQGLMTQ